jgi:hypothetical protein
MEHYAGIDVSLELSSVCVVDAQGKIVKEAKVASEPVLGQDARRERGVEPDERHFVRQNAVRKS